MLSQLKKLYIDTFSTLNIPRQQNITFYISEHELFGFLKIK